MADHAEGFVELMVGSQTVKDLIKLRKHGESLAFVVKRLAREALLKLEKENAEH